MYTGTWLTAKRLRAHGFLLALALWSVYAWVIVTPGLRDRNGNLKGTDFLHFYTLGSLAIRQRGADLYDINAQTALAGSRVPEAVGVRYLPLYPPQVSLLFAPFAHLSYGKALAMWWILSAGIYGACCFTIWRRCRNLRKHGGTVAMVAVAFPGFFHLIAWGQTSALALASFTVVYLCLTGRRKLIAGLALGCLIFKPQLGLAAAIVFVASWEWRVVGGAVISALAQLAVGIIYYGMEPTHSWLRSLWRAPGLGTLLEPRPYQTHCLRTFWAMLVPWNSLSLVLYVVSAVAILGLTIASWRTSENWALRYSLLLIATVLVSPHLTVYDLVILAPAFLLLTNWLVSQPHVPARGLIGTVLYFVYVLPLAGPIAQWTHVQLTVLAMSGLAYLLWKESSVKSPQASAAV